MTNITQAEALWQTAVIQAVMKMRPQFPEANGRMNKAQELALSGNVELLGDRCAKVTSQSDPLTSYLIEGGRCSCPDAGRTPGGLCKHLLAAGIVKRAIQIAKTFGTSEQEDETTDVCGIPKAFIVEIHGKPFITFQGLLHLAHQQGLVSLSEEVTHVTETYVMARAQAKMSDGRVFTGIGDSTPDNVGALVQPHWRRLAGTRAMARALRLALGIGTVCAAELCTD